MSKIERESTSEKVNKKRGGTTLFIYIIKPKAEMEIVHFCFGFVSMEHVYDKECT